MRVFKLAAPLVLTALLVVGGQEIPASRADMAPMNFHFSGYVLSGKDSGMMLDGILNVTVMGDAITAVLTMGDGTVVNGGGSLKGKAMTVSLPMGTMGSITGIGTNAGDAFLGNFSGPHAGDFGAWRAAAAPTTLSFAVTGSVAKGPSKGKSVIGDLIGVVEADGTMTGRYTDNSNVGPGIVVQTYPVHGYYLNSNLIASIVMAKMMSGGMMSTTMMAKTPAIMIAGHAATFFGLQAINGVLMGPTAGDSGSVSAVAQ